MSDLGWVLVTGGARRLGREFCLGFAAAGWDVLCHHHTSAEAAADTQAAVRDMGRICHTLNADLSLPDTATALLDQCLALAGEPPRCIVNNASIFEVDEVRTATAESLLRHFMTNTAAPLLLGNALREQVQRFASRQPPPPHTDGHPLVSAGRHCVVHVLDQKVHNLNPDYFSYTVSKLALERSVALQAQALAPWVRVCGLSPGLIYPSGPQTQENFDQASRVNLLQQRIQPSDVARCAAFMAGNPSLNGCALAADNGQHLVALDRDVMWAIEERAS